jgi:uncharacterized protein YlxW (UPF0749 family)
MFPLPILTYVKIGLVVAALLGAGYTGYSIEAGRFERYKAEQLAQTQKLQEEHQALADQIRKEKDAQIASINNSLTDALIQLRSRPSRAQSAANGQSGTGLSLSAEDATFLDREAARADILRSALDACYKQYDAIK